MTSLLLCLIPIELCLRKLKPCFNMMMFCISLAKESIKKTLQRKLLIKPCFVASDEEKKFIFE